MEPYEQVMEAVYAAIRELNRGQDPESALEPSPGTVLLGESATLDSLGMVTLLTTIEENIQRSFKQAISLIDVVPSARTGPWTVADLGQSVAEMIGYATRE
jgi:hypothetical protein